MCLYSCISCLFACLFACLLVCLSVCLIACLLVSFMVYGVCLLLSHSTPAAIFASKHKNTVGKLNGVMDETVDKLADYCVQRGVCSDFWRRNSKLKLLFVYVIHTCVMLF